MGGGGQAAPAAARAALYARAGRQDPDRASRPLIIAKPNDAEAFAAIHAEAFDRPWTAEDLYTLIDEPGGLALTDEDRLGFILIWVAAEEAEILTLAVSPTARRRGLGRRLVSAAVQAAAIRGARAMFLEVAVDNTAAIELYRASGFVEIRRRKGYYPRAGGAAVDALLFSLSLAATA